MKDHSDLLRQSYEDSARQAAAAGDKTEAAFYELAALAHPIVSKFMSERIEQLGTEAIYEIGLQLCATLFVELVSNLSGTADPEQVEPGLLRASRDLIREILRHNRSSIEIGPDAPAPKLHS